MSTLLPFADHGDMARYILEMSVDFLDCCFTDSTGRLSHKMVSPSKLTEDNLKFGIPFDGSSIAMFSTISSSDMFILPDYTTCWIDSFYTHKIMHVICDVANTSGDRSKFCPRSICKKVNSYMISTGLLDTVNIGLEAEFFMFNNVTYGCTPYNSHIQIEASSDSFGRPNPPIKKISSTLFLGNHDTRYPNNLGPGYGLSLPLDCYADIRNEISLHLKNIGIIPEYNHCEVAHFQHEISYKYGDMVTAADNFVNLKYIAKNTSMKYGLTTTFMPKPIHTQNGNGMHCNISLWKNGKNLFYGGSKDGVVLISEIAKYFIGGILSHSKSIAAFANPSVNSYRRLIDGFEAPTYLVYSTGNRSAAIRVPCILENNSSAVRIEVRFPDASGSVHLAISAIVLAGIDGIQKKIDPGPEFKRDVKFIDNTMRVERLPSCLAQALVELENDKEYLLKGGCFTEELISKYIEVKRKEVAACAPIASAKEFQLYYNL